MAGNRQNGFNDLLRNIGGLGAPFQAVKLGPSVVAVLATLGAFALIAIIGVTFLLSGHPLEAVIADALIITFIFPLIWLLLRFSERHPLIAALGGGQIVRLIEGQMGAKNKAIVIDQLPVVGGSKDASGGSAHE